MSDEPTIEQQVEVSITKVVDFYGDQIPAAQGTDNEIYVPLRPVATFLGLNISGQQQRIQRDPVLSKRVRRLRIDSGGGPQNQMCLPLDLLPGWLFGVSQARVAPDLQDKLNRYREECFKVLWNAFKGDILPAAPAPTDLTPAEQALAQAEAVAAIARQQVELERRQQSMAGYMRPFVQQTSRRLADHEQRLVSLELRLDPAANITDEQASELAMTVKNVAYRMGSADPDYARVWGAVYRRYRISGYKNLKRKDYDAALEWLSGWYDEIDKKGQTS